MNTRQENTALKIFLAGLAPVIYRVGGAAIEALPEIGSFLGRAIAVAWAAATSPVGLAVIGGVAVAGVSYGVYKVVTR